MMRSARCRPARNTHGAGYAPPTGPLIAETATDEPGMAYDDLLIKTYVLFEPDHAVKTRTTERATESFVARALSRQGSKCQILSTDGIDFRP